VEALLGQTAGDRDLVNMYSKVTPRLSVLWLQS